MNVTAASPFESCFLADLDNIARDLIQVFRLRFRQEEEKLSSPLLRWMDFRHRYVEQLPRPVVLSDKFPIANLPTDAALGLHQLVRKFETGADVNPYQGRGFILNNDTSGDAGHKRTDLLFADWNILHFHVTAKPHPGGQYFSAPSDYVAFCVVTRNAVAFLDVIRHPSRIGFANVDLFDTFARNWPEHIEQYRIRGILPAREPLTTKEISTLREGGVGTMYTYQRATYMSPGGGVTSACTPVRLTGACDHITDWVNLLAALADDPAGQIRMHPTVAIVPTPQFKLGICPSGLSVRETRSNTDFVLPQADPSTQQSWMHELNEAFSPGWAAKALYP